MTTVPGRIVKRAGITADKLRKGIGIRQTRLALLLESVHDPGVRKDPPETSQGILDLKSIWYAASRHAREHRGIPLAPHCILLSTITTTLITVFEKTLLLIAPLVQISTPLATGKYTRQEGTKGCFGKESIRLVPHIVIRLYRTFHLLSSAWLDLSRRNNPTALAYRGPRRPPTYYHDSTTLRQTGSL